MPLPPLGPELLIHSSFDDTAVRRAHAAGHLVRLAPGRYVRTDVWTPLDDSAREILRIMAVVSCLRTPVVVSHSSAAALWCLPRLGRRPGLVDVIDPAATSAWNSRYVRRHVAELAPDDETEMYGVRVTVPGRSALDLARQATFRTAVVGLDHALRHGLVDRKELLEQLDASTDQSRAKKARRALLFADPLANRPGESLSRLVIHEQRLAAPVLQQSFRGPNGQQADVDFWWPDVGVVGEFDGDVKYRDRSMRNGRSVEDVVVDEKNRENWIRALPDVRGFVRWTWREALAPGFLGALLSAAGVPHSKQGL